METEVIKGQLNYKLLTNSSCRLLGCQHSVDVWQSLLAVHRLVIPPEEELDLWLKFVGLCRKVFHLSFSFKYSHKLKGGKVRART